MRVYAQPADLTEYTGEEPPDGADRLLRNASRMLEARALRTAWYDTDADGMPTHPAVRAALRDAVCAQVAWWGEIGDSSGASAVGWGAVEIGSAKLSRSLTATDASASPARQLAEAAIDALTAPDLTPDIFRLGAVVSA
ncbi:hypothetical protein [Streptomyces sp. Z26]|uniref:hypothetical protein n=1 Tax=Streptomyces sp. Z26 TaxID=2500177 RepID=UPI000EF14A8F|nr:hypothetical protein [Streptomyces sp. Z26]RLL66991.1 hypothetical protein D7M15_09060 [Streptomyces sp. Z26]